MSNIEAYAIKFRGSGLCPSTLKVDLGILHLPARHTTSSCIGKLGHLVFSEPAETRTDSIQDKV